MEQKLNDNNRNYTKKIKEFYLYNIDVIYDLADRDL